MPRSQTAGEPMQFLQAVNWLQTSLPRLVEVVESLRVLARGAHRGNSTPDQASHVELGDRGASMEAHAGGCVEQCAGPGGQARRFVVPQERV